MLEIICQRGEFDLQMYNTYLTALFGYICQIVY